MQSVKQFWPVFCPETDLSARGRPKSLSEDQNGLRRQIRPIRRSRCNRTRRPPRSVLYVCASYRTALRAGCDRRQCRANRAGCFGVLSCAARAALLRRFVAVLAASGLLALQRWRFDGRGGSPPSPRRADTALPPFPRRAPASRPCGNYSGGQGVRSRAPLPLVAVVARRARALPRRARSPVNSGASACALRLPRAAARSRLRRARPARLVAPPARPLALRAWPTRGQASDRSHDRPLGHDATHARPQGYRPGLTASDGQRKRRPLSRAL